MRNRSAEFIRNLEAESPPPAPPPAAPARRSAPRKAAETKAPGSSRDGLKHIGGYFGDETVEKVALLRARLKLDNSELIELAINELFAKHRAKRAFGDA